MANDTALRQAKVSSIDYKTGKMRVTYPDRSDSVSVEMPMISNNTYNMPNVGDAVMVALDGHGGTSGVVLGTMHNKPISPEAFGKQDYMRIGMPGGSYIDSDIGKIGVNGDTITVKGKTTIDIEGGGAVTIKGDSITIESSGAINIKAGGSLTLTDSSGSIALSKIIAHCG